MSDQDQQLALAKTFIKALLEQSLTDPEDTIDSIATEIWFFARRLGLTDKPAREERDGARHECAEAKEALGSAFLKASVSEDRLSLVGECNGLKQQLEGATIKITQLQDHAEKLSKGLTVVAEEGERFEKERNEALAKLSELRSRLDGGENDYRALERIMSPVLDFDDVSCPGVLTTTFPNGTHLSFGCGASGRLNMVVIKNAEVSVNRKE